MPVHREWFMTVAHPAPWGWKIAAYMWTKAIAAGVLIVAAMLLALGTENESVLISIASPIVAMIFTGLTALILIFDLKRPDRFYYLLTNPNLRSWVVIGAYILIGYGRLSFGWLFTSILAGTPSGFIVYPAAAFGMVRLAIPLSSSRKARGATCGRVGSFCGSCCHRRLSRVRRS